MSVLLGHRNQGDLDWTQGGTSLHPFGKAVSSPLCIKLKWVTYIHFSCSLLFILLPSSYKIFFAQTFISQQICSLEEDTALPVQYSQVLPCLVSSAGSKRFFPFCAVVIQLNEDGKNKTKPKNSPEISFVFIPLALIHCSLTSHSQMIYHVSSLLIYFQLFCFCCLSPPLCCAVLSHSVVFDSL